ncbi:unnamed protein product [Polarella glacialis]|uniref:valine--tRNA ligase n=1 Tax=Polarella glacialis TaxID=89957 RepID=A0A813I3P9_POLGL|nr:unnamed protein product [Polarella glacialis]
MLVERQLVSEGTTRQKVGRDEFLRRVWEWKGEKGGAIVDQLRRLGASADWSREQFTLNEQMSASVVEAFCRMHEMGIIFRGKRMVTLLQLVLFFICLLLLLVFGLVLLILDFSLSPKCIQGKLEPSASDGCERPGGPAIVTVVVVVVVVVIVVVVVCCCSCCSFCCCCCCCSCSCCCCCCYCYCCCCCCSCCCCCVTYNNSHKENENDNSDMQLGRLNTLK